MNQEVITEVTQFLIKNPGYCKWGDERIASKLVCTIEEAHAAKAWVRLNMEEKVEQPIKICPEKSNTLDNTSENDSSITEFDKYLKAQGISPEDVKSVKYWQTVGGEFRFSVVTKNDGIELPSLEDIKNSFKTTTQFEIKAASHDSAGTLMVFLSDKHIGALTKEDALYDNKYDAKEFRDRMIKVMNEIGNVYSLRGPLDKIIVIDLGDALDGYDGQTTRGGHTLPQNMTNKEAFEVFVSVHKAFYNALLSSGFAETYEIYHISNSNHGGEFEHFATRCLQEYLKASYRGVKMEVFDKFITPITVDNHTYLLTHGKDTEDMKHGLPLTLDAKTENYIKDYVLHHSIPTKNLHFIKGDLHQASTQQGKHFRYRNVPSMYGSSKWIMTNFGYTKPGCSFELIEDGGIKQWELWF